MKRNFFYLFTVLTFFLVVSCKDNQNNDNNIYNKLSVTAQIQGFELEGNSAKWSEGDILYIANESDFKQKKFSKLSIKEGIGTSKAVFSGILYGDQNGESLYAFLGNPNTIDESNDGLSLGTDAFSPLPMGDNPKNASPFFGKVEKISDNEFTVNLNSPCALLSLTMSGAPDNTSLANVFVPGDAMKSGIVYNVGGDSDNGFTLSTGESDFSWNVYEKNISTSNGDLNCFLPVIPSEQGTAPFSVRFVFSDGKAYNGTVNSENLTSVKSGEIIESTSQLSLDNDYTPVPTGIRKLKTYQLGEALMFYGNQCAYSSAISPNGNCYAVYGDYIYLGWWKGGLKNRNMMLTRFNTVTKKFVTIEFPDKHIGYLGQYYLAEQKDPNADLTNLKGDSHNSIAIGICPNDGTIHLVYDLHGYDKNSKWPYFNYRKSKADILNVSDEEFTKELFEDRRENFPGNESFVFDHQTYPNFLTMNDGRMAYYYRYGASGKGDSYLMLYSGDGKGEWTTRNVQLSKGMNLASDYDKYSIYGTMKYINNKFCLGFHIRHFERNVNANEGMHYIESDNPFIDNMWSDAFGNERQLPIQAITDFEFEPEPTTYGTNITGSPSFIETENGVLHLVTQVFKSADDNTSTTLHYFKPKGAMEFTMQQTQGIGQLFAFGSTIFMIGLDGYTPYFASCPENTNNWNVLLSDTDCEFNRALPILVGNKIYLFSMMTAAKQSNSEPIYLLEYELLF